MMQVDWRLRGNSGFTLMELLVAVAVLGIMAAIAIPTFSVWLPNYRLGGAARDLYSNFQFARMNAIKSNTDWAIVFDQASTPGRYYICSGQGANGAWDGPVAMGGDDTSEKTVNFMSYDSDGNIDLGHGNLAVDKPGNPFIAGDNVVYQGNDWVNFTPRGTCGKVGYVYLHNGKEVVFAIHTRTNGLIQLLKWNGGVWK